MHAELFKLVSEFNRWNANITSNSCWVDMWSICYPALEG